MRREALVNNSTKHNINGRIRAICIQHLGPPGYTHIYKFKPDGSKENDIIVNGPQDRQNSSIITVKKKLTWGQKSACLTCIMVE